MLNVHGGRISMLAVSSLLIAGIGATGAYADGVPSPDSTVVRDGAHWYTQAYENTATGAYTDPEQSDVTGPHRAPFGTGSHKLTVGQFEVQTELYRTNDYDGVELADLTRLEYSTLARNTAGGADRQPAYLRLSVDTNGDLKTIEDNLFFFPANNGTVVNGQWQNWNVTEGLINVDGDTGAGGATTLAAYVAANAGAVLVNAPYDATHDAGAVSLIAGAAASQTRGEYFVDRVIVGEAGQDTLFDFGPNVETAGATSDLTVTEGNLQGWAHQAYDDVNYLGSNQQFVAGPQTPPLGGGSLKMSLSSADNEERVELFRTEQYDGTLVRDLRTMTYSTFSKADAGNTNPQQPSFLRLSVDADGNGTGPVDSLFFFPANNGTPAQNAWQPWDAGNGIWGVNGDQGPQGVTLEQYVVAHPDATIAKNEDAADPSQVDGGVAFIAGGSGTGSQMNGQYFLDAINISKVDAATSSVESGKEFDLEPGQPSVSIGDAQVSEGNDGATLSFPVTVANPTAQDVTVHYATSNGTATAGSDYAATSGDLTIPAGQTADSIDVLVLSDSVNEPDEAMTLTITSPGYGTLGDDTATGTITNDDPVVVPGEATVSIGDAQVVEGNNGATLSFPVTVTNPTTQPVTVHYATSNGSATAGSDYAATSGSLTIAGGETTGKIDVLVLSDTVNEPTETMTVTITSPGYGILGDDTATGTITNDDPVVVTPPVVTPPVVTPPVVTPPVVTPPVVTPPVSDDPRDLAGLVVKGFGHKAGNDVVVANAVDGAAGATVKLFRRTKNGTFRKVASAVLNSKGNYRFKDIVDLNGNAKNRYQVKVSRTDLTASARRGISIR